MMIADFSYKKVSVNPGYKAVLSHISCREMDGVGVFNLYLQIWHLDYYLFLNKKTSTYVHNTVLLQSNSLNSSLVVRPDTRYYFWNVVILGSQRRLIALKLPM